MKKPEIPKDEAARISALKSLNILDTVTEENFDRITRMASKVFSVPVALVSLIDTDRQWFKSAVGLEARETPRDISFCGHAILGDDIFVVPDTLEDKRFVDNPLVTNDPGIRFYAGCPLRSVNHSKIGTLCLIDRQPRQFSDEDRLMLKDLATMVEREIVLIELATSDELTGVYNRRGFMALGEKSLKLCQRSHLPASLVYLDLDDFKKINDSYGHAEGDRVLSLFAENIKDISRDSDVVARIGGDEFAILFADSLGDGSESIISRIKNGLKKIILREKLNYEIGFTYGIISYDPDKHSSLAELLEQGDALMYQHKSDKYPLKNPR